MNASISNGERSCLVCGMKSEGINNGVDSCRACSAFYRRCILLKKIYVCRFRGDCSLTVSRRHLCKRCRFNRCKQIGMLSICGAKSKIRETYDESYSNCIISKVVKSKQIKTEFLTPMLHKVETIYDMLNKQRKNAELKLLEDQPLAAFSDPTKEFEQISICSAPLLDKIMEVTLPMVAQFCNDAFTEYTFLSENDQWILFRSFQSELFYFEMELRTAKAGLFPINIRQISCATVVEQINPDSFFTECLDIFQRDKSAVMRRFAENNIAVVSKMYIDTLKRLELTSFERSALVSLSMWTADFNLEVAENVYDLCYLMRSKIFKELHVYYTEVQRNYDYANRIGQLMDVLIEAKFRTDMMRKEIQVYVLFDALNNDGAFYSLLRN